MRAMNSAFRTVGAGAARLSRVAMVAGISAGLVLPAAPAHAAGLPTASTTSTGEPRRILSGWLPYWSTRNSLETAEANAELFTDAMPFWYDFKTSGVLARKSSATTDAVIADTVDRLRAKGIPVFPTVTQSHDAPAMAAFLADPAQRAAHVSDLVSEVRRRGYSGIDLDYESMNFGGTVTSTTAVRNGFSLLAAELGSALRAEGKKLSITVGPRTSDSPYGNWPAYDYAALGAAADRFRIMTYDYGWKGGSPRAVSPQWWVEDVLEYAVQRVPARKVWMGVPTYGYDWPAGARGTGVSFAQAKALQAKHGVTSTWVETVSATDLRPVRAPMFTYTDASGVLHTVWYNDAASIRALVGLVGKYRLGGAAMWTVGGEDPAAWGSLRSYAHAVAPQPTAASLTLSRWKVRTGEKSTLTSRVQDASGSPVPRLRVTLQGRPMGVLGAPWRRLAAAATDDTGRVAFELAPGAGMHYRVVSSSSWGHRAASSRVVRFAVLRKVAAVGSTGISRGKRIVQVRGAVFPAAAGLKVQQQRRLSGRWVTVASGMTDSRGAYRLSTPVRSGGAHIYRTVVVAGAPYGYGTSLPVPIRVPAVRR